MIYDTGITDFDFTSALTNSFQEILPNTQKSDAEDIDLELLEEIAFSDELLNGNAPTKEVADTIVVDDIVYDNNYFRPSYTLKYKTPIEYRTQLGFK